MNWLDQIVAWDYQTLSWLNQVIIKHPQFDFLFKFLAVGLIYSIPFILIIGYFYAEKYKKVMVMAALAGLFAWRVIGKLVSIVYFRERPFQNTLIDLKEIIFHRPTYSFPSDHALFLAAIFLIFWLYGYKKLAAAVGIIGLIISLLRVMVGLHYPLDILGGLILGFLTAVGLFWQRKIIERYIALPIIKLVYRIIKH